mmetsp:Transcript_20715/g.55956  ORF Transcript_20715/g.55956 Transcript_20715/m.55956 type:complete len:267 (-) Transcript_20715:346-1146(-)
MMGSMYCTPSWAMPVALVMSTSKPLVKSDDFSRKRASSSPSVSGVLKGWAHRLAHSSVTSCTASRSAVRTSLRRSSIEWATSRTAPARVGTACVRIPSAVEASTGAPLNSRSSSSSHLTPPDVSSPRACSDRSEKRSSVSQDEFTTALRAYTAMRTCWAPPWTAPPPSAPSSSPPASASAAAATACCWRLWVRARCAEVTAATSLTYRLDTASSAVAARAAVAEEGRSWPRAASEKASPSMSMGKSRVEWMPRKHVSTPERWAAVT